MGNYDEQSLLTNIGKDIWHARHTLLVFVSYVGWHPSAIGVQVATVWSFIWSFQTQIE